MMLNHINEIKLGKTNWGNCQTWKPWIDPVEQRVFSSYNNGSTSLHSSIKFIN